MRAVRLLLAAVLFVAGCGVRTPPRLDIAAMISARGAVEARRELTARVLADPRDVQARLALAELADTTGRPSEAIEQLEAVVRLGGPIGTRWRDEDRARLGRLLLARGRVRLARGAATALRDFERAASFGRGAGADELAQARVAVAIAQLKLVDAKERAKGRAMLAAHVTRAAASRSAPTSTEAAWRGAKPDASPVERGAFGVWLWRLGARREAYDQLVAWHDATKPPRDPELQGAYLRALAWWSPLWLGEVKPPPAEDLVGPERCWFPGTDCVPAATDEPPLSPVPALDAEPRVAVAVRYAATRFELADMSRAASAATAETVTPVDAAGSRGPGDAASSRDSGDATPGGSGDATSRGSGDAARSRASGGTLISRGPNDAATSRGRIDASALLPIARAFSRDPAIAERLGRDLVASAPDAAIAHATLGALFDALADPARARAEWQAAVDASAEPAFVRGLAEATARAGDAPAAVVFATHAAAASGDPGVVWTSVAGELVGAGQLVDALTAARNALDLAGPEVLPRAVDVAIAASRGLGRTQQADGLLAQQMRLGGRSTREDAEARAALAAHRERSTAATVARLWVASRTQPRDIEMRAALVDALDADDPRRLTIMDELLRLAGDPDPARAFAAVRALRR